MKYLKVTWNDLFFVIFCADLVIIFSFFTIGYIYQGEEFRYWIKFLMIAIVSGLGIVKRIKIIRDR